MTLEELVHASETSRFQLTESYAHMRSTLDVPSRIKHSLMEKPAKWLGVSLVAGFLASFLIRKKKAPPKVESLKRQRGFMFGLLTLAITLGKPLAKAYAAKVIKDHLEARFLSGKHARLTSPGKRPY